MSVAFREPLSEPQEAQERASLTVLMVHFSDYEVDSRVQRQAQALAARGDHVHCVCIGPRSRTVLGSGSITTHPVACPKPHAGAASYAKSYATFFGAALRAVTRLDRELSPNLVQIHNMPNFLTFAAARSKLRGTRIVLDMHDTFPELFSTMFGSDRVAALSRAAYWEERWSARLASEVMTVTDAARTRLAARGVGGGSITVVMNSPDERVFGPPREPAEVPAEGPVRLVYHGGTSERFGVESLIAAVGLLEPDEARVSLDVYGAFDDASALPALAAAEAPGHVRLAPKPTPYVEIPAKLASAHVGVVPTIRNEFTELLLPVKLLEYVHMGLPVVSSRLPVIEEHFGDDSIWFYDPGSAQSLADTVRRLLADPAEAAARASRASERLSGYGWRAQSARYLGVIDRLASAKVTRA